MQQERLPGELPVGNPPVTPGNPIDPNTMQPYTPGGIPGSNPMIPGPSPISLPATPPPLPPTEVIKEPARIKYKNVTYNIVSNYAGDKDSLKPTPGTQRAVQTLMGTMLSHGIAALQSKHNIKIEKLDNLKIIESVPQGVKEKDENGKTVTKQVVTLTLEYKYRDEKDKKIKTVTTEIKKVLKLTGKERSTIKKECIATDRDLNIETAYKAYEEAMKILKSPKGITDGREITFEPFHVKPATLSAEAKEIYKPEAKEGTEGPDEAEDGPDSARDKPSTGSEKPTSKASKSADTPPVDEDEESKPFAMREAEKPKMKFNEGSKSNGVETDYIPFFKRDDKEHPPSWIDYLCKGTIRDPKNPKHIISKSKNTHFTQEEVYEVLKKLLISEKKFTDHFYTNPLNRLSNREKVILKRFILLFHKTRFEKNKKNIIINQRSLCSYKTRQYFIKIMKRIMNGLSEDNATADEIAEKSANKGDMITKHGSKLEQNITAICMKNIDLRKYIESIEDSIATFLENN